MCSLSPSLSSGLVLWVACLEQVNTTVDVLLSPCPSAAYWPIPCHFSCFPLVCIPPCSSFTSCLGCYILGAFSWLCVLQSGAVLQPLVWHSPVPLEKTNKKLRGALPNAAWWECTEGETQISQRKRTKETFLSCFLLGGGQRWEREAPMPFPIRNNCSSLLWPGFDSLKVSRSVNLTKWGMSI